MHRTCVDCEAVQTKVSENTTTTTKTKDEVVADVPSKVTTTVTESLDGSSETTKVVESPGVTITATTMAPSTSVGPVNPSVPTTTTTVEAVITPTEEMSVEVTVSTAINQIKAIPEADNVVPVITIPAPTSGASEVTVSADVVSTIVGADASFAVSNSDGQKVEIPKDTLNALLGNNSGVTTVTLSVEKKAPADLPAVQQGSVYGQAAVIDVSLFMGENNIHLLGGDCWIWMPFTHPDVSHADDMTVSYIDDAGVRHTVTGHTYDPVTNMVGFMTNHHSVYAAEANSDIRDAMYKPPVFVPVPDDDFLPPVQVVQPEGDDTTTKIACVAAGAVAALLAILLVATSRGKF